MANNANVVGLQDVGDREAANAVPRSSSSSAEASTRAAPAWTRDGVLQLDTAVKWKGGRKKTHRVAGRRGRPPKDPRKGVAIYMQKRAAERVSGSSESGSRGRAEAAQTDEAEGRVAAGEELDSDTTPRRGRKRRASSPGEVARRCAKVVGSSQDFASKAHGQRMWGGSPGDDCSVSECAESELVELSLGAVTWLAMGVVVPAMKLRLAADISEVDHTF